MVHVVYLALVVAAFFVGRYFPQLEAAEKTVVAAGKQVIDTAKDWKV